VFSGAVLLAGGSVADALLIAAQRPANSSGPGRQAPGVRARRRRLVMLATEWVAKPRPAAVLAATEEYRGAVVDVTWRKRMMTHATDFTTALSRFEQILAAALPAREVGAAPEAGTVEVYLPGGDIVSVADPADFDPAAAPGATGVMRLSAAGGPVAHGSVTFPGMAFPPSHHADVALVAAAVRWLAVRRGDVD
jgi:hypothetical protein